MTSDGEGGPLRTGVEYFGSVESGVEDASAPRFCQSAKMRRSAISASSPTTKPSVVHPRRVNVQRQMLDTSNPISNAMSSATIKCTFDDTGAKERPRPITP